MNYLPFAAARCWPEDELAGDETNWWSINGRALLGLLRAMGFAEVEVTYRTPLWRRAIRAALESDHGFRRGLRGQRLVVHARR